MAKLYKFDTNVQAAASQPRGLKYVDNGQVLKIIH